MIPDTHFGITSQRIPPRGFRALWAWVRRRFRRRRKLKGRYYLDAAYDLAQAFCQDTSKTRQKSHADFLNR